MEIFIATFLFILVFAIFFLIAVILIGIRTYRITHEQKLEQKKLKLHLKHEKVTTLN